MSHPPPWSPPPGSPLPPEDARAGTAGFWLRFAAALLDGLVIGVAVALVLNRMGIDDELAESYVSIVVGAFYFPLQEGGPRGQTLGKRLCGIRVVDETTRDTITVGRALVRYLVSLVSGFACLIGYLWMLTDPARQTWHDKAARTIVVRV